MRFLPKEPGRLGDIWNHSAAMAAERRPAVRRASADEEAHDILAAEEFGVPAPDPALHHDPAHDVLAAEEFAVPAPSLHHGPVTLPADPTGIGEPHDVLAAEEFAMPAPPGPTSGRAGRARSQSSRAALVVLGAAVVLAARRGWRRR
jgi:hypothetical protein